LQNKPLFALDEGFWLVGSWVFDNTIYVLNKDLFMMTSNCLSSHYVTFTNRPLRKLPSIIKLTKTNLYGNSRFQRDLVLKYLPVGSSEPSKSYILRVTSIYTIAFFPMEFKRYS
jgi:hypothetical protein